MRLCTFHNFHNFRTFHNFPATSANPNIDVYASHSWHFIYYCIYNVFLIIIRQHLTILLFTLHSHTLAYTPNNVTFLCTYC